MLLKLLSDYPKGDICSPYVRDGASTILILILNLHLHLHISGMANHRWEHVLINIIRTTLAGQAGERGFLVHSMFFPLASLGNCAVFTCGEFLLGNFGSFASTHRHRPTALSGPPGGGVSFPFHFVSGHSFYLATSLLLVYTIGSY